MRAIVLGLVACCALNAALRTRLPAPRAPAGFRLEADSAVEDAALLGLGMRRLAADLGLIRLLIYYGTPENPEVQIEEPGSHPWVGPEHPELSYGGGVYAELGPRAERVLDIDPGFTYIAIYAASALAFNLNRADESLDVLRYALKRDPNNIELKQYVAAVGLSRHGNREAVVALLEPMLSQPDCPTMMKNMVAFLYLQMGRRDKAVALYREIAETSRDAGYRDLARSMLRRLGQ